MWGINENKCFFLNEMIAACAQRGWQCDPGVCISSGVWGMREEPSGCWEGMSRAEWKVGTWRTSLLKCGNRCQKLRFSLMNALLVSLKREEVGNAACGLPCLCCGSVLFQTCGFLSDVSPSYQCTPGYVKSWSLSLLVSRLDLAAGGQFKGNHLLWLQAETFLCLGMWKAAS